MSVGARSIESRGGRAGPAKELAVHVANHRDGVGAGEEVDRELGVHATTARAATTK
jgi:hypothetical protein